MTKEAMNWIDDLLEGTISPEDHRALMILLKSDPEVLEYYCQQADIHGRLEWELKPFEAGDSPAPPKGPLISTRRPLSSHWFQIAALIALFVGIAAFVSRQIPGAPDGDGVSVVTPPPRELSPPGKLSTEGVPMARLTKSRDARWNHDSPRDGTWLKPGSLNLLSGSAEITFDTGARIILLGPAELRLVDPFQAKLLQGKASVFMPDSGSQFSLHTPSTSFSRNNSSFAVAVAADGTVEVHALRGLVEATPRANPQLARFLSQNESLLLSEQAILEGRQIRHAIGSFDQDLPVSLSAVPSRYLHWSFDTSDSGVIPEIGVHAGPPFPARLLAKPGTADEADAQFIRGRFGEAISMGGSGAFLASGFPGIAGAAARTVAFWVRLPQDPLISQAYSMVSWGPPQSQSGEKWQIAWNAQTEGVGVKGAIRTEFGGGWVIGETDLRDGRWHHVACVFLGGESVNVATHIRHYIDGQLERVSWAQAKTINTRLNLPSALPTYFGRRLENDRLSTGFSGDLDEIYIFPAALTPQQIGNLYRQNAAPKILMPGF